MISAMPIRRWARNFEKAALRPIAFLARRWLWRASGGGGRLGRLERRINELEQRVRELTGLLMIQLDDRQVEHREQTGRAEAPREAA